MLFKYHLILFVSTFAHTFADDLEGYVPGFIVESLFLPSGCTYRSREGDFIYQHYVGTLEDGTQFDSSYSRGSTYNFRLGVGEVIKGIDMGMKGMCKGEKRRITIPPELGYGNRAVGSIPAGSTLIFDVELADLEPSGFKIELLYMPEGCKRRSAAGDYIREHYNGTFTDGSLFDSSYSRNRTYDFTLGERQVIKGVDMGLMNMCQGERRRLVIPPILAYGSGGYGDIIPPESTLVFDVELVEIVYGRLKWHKIDGPTCSPDDQAQYQDTVSVLFSLFSETGFKFAGGEEPYEFILGDENILNGVNQGVLGMCIGERRRLRIPPELAVGDVNNIGIPQNERLTFDVELVDMKKEDLFKAIDANSDKYLSKTEVENWILNNDAFKDRIAEGEELVRLRSYYYEERDKDDNGWITRNEFYGINTGHDEL